MSEPTSDALKALGRDRDEFVEFRGSASPMSLDKLRDGFEEYFEGDTGDAERHKPRIGVEHASAGGKCPRKRWYSANQTGKDDFDQGISERGNRIEDFVYDILCLVAEGTPYTAVNDVPAYYQKKVIVDGDETTLEITGETDPAIIDANGATVEMLTEVKSTQNLDRDKLPKQKHIVQLNTYLSILNLDYGFIVYVDPNDFDYHFCHIEQDPGLWEQTIFLHEMVHEYRVKDSLPPAMPQQEDECKWCMYESLCDRNDPGRDHRIND